MNPRPTLREFLTSYAESGAKYNFIGFEIVDQLDLAESNKLLQHLFVEEELNSNAKSLIKLFVALKCIKLQRVQNDRGAGNTMTACVNAIKVHILFAT